MESMSRQELEALVKTVTQQMHTAAAELNFEQAAVLRDKMVELKKQLLELG
jgi:excinuclease ABC subunit B